MIHPTALASVVETLGAEASKAEVTSERLASYATSLAALKDTIPNFPESEIDSPSAKLLLGMVTALTAAVPASLTEMQAGASAIKEYADKLTEAQAAARTALAQAQALQEQERARSVDPAVLAAHQEMLLPVIQPSPHAQLGVGRLASDAIAIATEAATALRETLKQHQVSLTDAIATMGRSVSPLPPATDPPGGGS